MNNFLQRTISGAIFVILIVGAILWNQYSFAILFTIITGLSLYEFHTLTNSQNHIKVNKTTAILGGSILFISSFLNAIQIISGKVFLIYGIYIIINFIAELYRKQEQPIHNLSYFLLGQIYIALPFSLLSYILLIPTYQPIILLAVFITIWVNDTGAYLTGMTFGKHHLFERISPKKSWEGFIGGAIFALISGYVFSLFIPEIKLFEWLIFSEIIVIFGTFGDLIESLIKRTLQVKDSGNLIPGHGGILDRFDSMLLAAPAIFIYLQFIL